MQFGRRAQIVVVSLSCSAGHWRITIPRKRNREANDPEKTSIGDPLYPPKFLVVGGIGLPFRDLRYWGSIVTSRSSLLARRSVTRLDDWTNSTSFLLTT